MRFTEVIDTTAAPVAAFRFLSNFNNLPKWDPSIVGVEQPTEGGVGGDTRFEVTLSFLGIQSTLDYRVEEYEPNRRAVLVGTAATVTATDTILVKPRRGGCRVTWDADIRFAGPLQLLDPVFAWLFASSVRSAISNLRRELNKLPRRQMTTT